MAIKPKLKLALSDIDKAAEKIIIIDNALPLEDQNKIENLVMNSGGGVKYDFLASATFGAKINEKEMVQIKSEIEKSGWNRNAADVSQFVHMLVNKTFTSKVPQPGMMQPGMIQPGMMQPQPGMMQQGQQNRRPPDNNFMRDNNQIFSPHFDNFLSVITALPHTITEMGRCKINVVPRQTTNALYGIPHIDSNMPDLASNAMIGIYYVNDSDGDTFIFNQKASDWHRPGNKPPLTLKAKVAPVKGRLVVFSAHLIHAAGMPKNHDFRCVINMNYIGVPRKS